MYITVFLIQANSNPGSIYATASVVSTASTGGIEIFADDTATTEEINAALAEAARQMCRSNGENVATDQPVVIFGGAVVVA